MKIIEYNNYLDETKKNILIKEKECVYEEKSFTTPQSIVKMLNEVYRLNKKAEEYIYLLAFDTKMNMIGVFEIAHGTVNLTCYSPREILIRVLLLGAVSIVLVHNHPSGNTEPSVEDLSSTKRLLQACDIMGITFCDHIIVGNKYYSFKENGLMEL